jgi:DNA-binding NarL/FixJ family response regulator
MTGQMPIRVALVEDDAKLAAAVSVIIEDTGDMHCIGHVGSGEAALAQLPSLMPDVVLMDINLPRMSGIECAARLKTTLAAVQIVMLTAFDDSEHVFESLKAGATGYVLKRAPGAEIIAAVRDVHHGGAPMSGSIARKVVGYFAHQRPSPELDALSERELDVLHALEHGQQYKEIADSLAITINTVRKHIRSIYEKLQVHSRAEAVRKLGAIRA